MKLRLRLAEVMKPKIDFFVALTTYVTESLGILVSRLHVTAALTLPHKFFPFVAIHDILS